MRPFAASTQSYEDWLRDRVRVVEADLDAKRAEMRRSLWKFFRGSFYRWCEMAGAGEGPLVTAIGDHHVENFGTWRDAEGRLVWGANDFDEAAELPYSFDLIRLAASADVAVREEMLKLPAEHVAAAILRGYREGLEQGGRPFVLEERDEWLRRAAMGATRRGKAFWKRMKGLEEAESVPGEVRRLLEEAMAPAEPDGGVRRRVSGLGSLGRRRYVQLGVRFGSLIAREAKELSPPAAAWAGIEESEGIRAGVLVAGSVRACDPYTRVSGGWLVRRLGPECSRLDLTDLNEKREEEELMEAMGFETANAHLATGDAAAILEDLKGRKKGWLHRAASSLTVSLYSDYKAWKKG